MNIRSRIVNCTPHDISVELRDSSIVVVKSSGNVIRVTETVEEVCGLINGVPRVRKVLGEVKGIPEPARDTLYLVSAMVLAASDRKDLIAPDTGVTAVRNDKGHIVAVKNFVIK